MSYGFRMTRLMPLQLSQRQSSHIILSCRNGLPVRRAARSPQRGQYSGGALPFSRRSNSAMRASRAGTLAAFSFVVRHASQRSSKSTRSFNDTI